MSIERAVYYNVDVAWNDVHMGFAEITGLDGSRSITLKRGVADRRWTDWFRSTGSTGSTARTLVITLFNERRQPVTVWTVTNAHPLKVAAPDLNATANEVAIESLELTHEGIQLHNDSRDGTIARAQRGLP